LFERAGFGDVLRGGLVVFGGFLPREDLASEEFLDVGGQGQALLAFDAAA